MAKKKVTFKQFKEIYVKSGCALSEKNIDYGVLLCMVSNYHYKSADELDKDGFVHAGERYRQIARDMHNELDKLGFFDN